MQQNEGETPEVFRDTVREAFEKRYPSLISLFKSLQASDDQGVGWETTVEGVNIEVDQREQ